MFDACAGDDDAIVAIEKQGSVRDRRGPNAYHATFS
jgi:hypothetical protein